MTGAKYRARMLRLCIAGAVLPWLAHAEGLPLTDEARAYWRDCAERIAEPAERPLRARRIGSTRETIDLLLALVLAGEKTMTTTSPWLYDGELQAPPAAGDTWVVMDGTGQPAAVVRTTSVKVLPMDRITAADTQGEGPAARQIDAWRRVHWNFLTRALAPLGRAPAADMPVTLEYFDVLCPRPAQ